MKGVILAGGTGSRLAPLTKVTNKHLLPIYDKPMIYYPILSLREAGITSVLLVSGKGHAGHFLELLGSGDDLGVKLSYEVQDRAGGIAEALSLAQDFAEDQKMAVMLGDNVYEDNLSPFMQDFEEGEEDVHIFLKVVDKPQSYGVPRFEGEKIVEILEKPSVAPSPYAVTGCYLFTPDVFEVIRNLKPSARGELEISDVNDHYVQKDSLGYSTLEGFWGDCGESIDAMMNVSRHIQTHGFKT